MIINGFRLRYDPVGMEEETSLEHDKRIVPYGDLVIYDKKCHRNEVSFDMILVGGEIEDIVGMIQSYRLIHLEYKHYNGWFYVTSMNKSWIKDVPRGRVVSYKLGGIYIGNQYLRMGVFKTYQFTDFNIPQDPVIVVPGTSFATEITQPSTFTRTGFGGEVLRCFRGVIEDIYFKGIKRIFNDGFCIMDVNNRRVYHECSPEGIVNINNKFLSFLSGTNVLNELGVLRISRDNTHILTIFSMGNISRYDERTLYPHPINPKAKLNYADLYMKYGTNYIEINPKHRELRVTPVHMYIATNPTIAIGTFRRHRENPQPFIIDTLGWNNEHQRLSQDLCPGYIHRKSNDIGSFVMGSNNIIDHGRDNIPRNTERWFIGHVDTTRIIISPSIEWTLGTGWTRHTDGTTYFGTANYARTNTANPIIVVRNIPVSGEYAIWLMVSRLHNPPNAVVNMVGRINFGGIVQNFTIPIADGNESGWAFMGTHLLASGAHNFQIDIVSGGGNFLHLYQMIIVPVSIPSEDTGFSTMQDAISDTNIAIEIS